MGHPGYYLLFNLKGSAAAEPEPWIPILLVVIIFSSAISSPSSKISNFKECFRVYIFSGRGREVKLIHKLFPFMIYSSHQTLFISIFALSEKIMAIKYVKYVHYILISTTFKPNQFWRWKIQLVDFFFSNTQSITELRGTIAEIFILKFNSSVLSPHRS